ncbi:MULTISPECIES: HNH endonuclease [Paenarthrobacter]|uniref:HNH endonuclease n=1 Tax=Paenarthrobacter TaxID=1742992 RepID=UPI000396C12C|nr:MULTISPECIES: HNH endonuclease signature motif containing protein [Paenarthrobacter]UOD83545.1 HNH endonuclease [Paenarthrobacter ureafaciens]WOC63322.1 HNH endonuclease signature motif containing protein [Paenarthrobacter sp. AT5]
MLRRAENVRLEHRPGFWTRKGPIALAIGNKTYLLGKMPKTEFRERQASQRRQPMPLVTIGGRRYWQFQNKFYWENDGLKSDEIYALLVTREQRQRRHIDLAQATVAAGSAPRGSASRRAIPDDVKQYIWARDEGRCQNCGTTTELQFDHIIPLALNGSNNIENLQLLCGPCNRAKSAGLTNRR